MNEKELKITKSKFIDKNFGENIEYFKIYNGEEFAIIFGLGEKIAVEQFSNIDNLVEKYIEKYYETRFLRDMLNEN